ncbi:hypothetical protein BZG78_08390 [Salinivibrio sp. MA351]|uniref:hypothetical protein n=1 Tax=Salinivibrio sp. MA351 TaxID=1909453 RepID=UPI000988A6C7|nr:hypothetical protein [Salinivibrio sp. MA351]OOE98674.1 hypothetical protein BZG78_08390 [Salinivibrio sp. MA351]
MRISSLVWPAIVLAIAIAASISAGDALHGLAIMAPALFFFYPDKLASWLLLLGMAALALSLPQLPALLAASTLLILPALSLWFNPDRHPHVKWLLGAVMLAIFAGIMALQSEAKLGGAPWFLALQLAALCGLWLSMQYWPGYQPPRRGAWLVLLILAAAVGWPSALWSVAVVAMIGLLQWVALTPRLAASRHLAMHILPCVPFLVIAWRVPYQLTMSLLVAWATMLAAIWVGEYLLLEDSDDN